MLAPVTTPENHMRLSGSVLDLCTITIVHACPETILLITGVIEVSRAGLNRTRTKEETSVGASGVTERNNILPYRRPLIISRTVSHDKEQSRHKTHDDTNYQACRYCSPAPLTHRNNAGVMVAVVTSPPTLLISVGAGHKHTDNTGENYCN